MFQGKGIKFKTNSGVDKEGECNVPDVGPCPFTYTIHLLMTWRSEGYLNSMGFTILNKLFGSKCSSSVSMDLIDIGEDFKFWIRFEIGSIMR